MPQLAGAKCVICGDRILEHSEGQFCPRCGNPTHKTCLDKLDIATITSGCPRCGGDPAQAPKHELPKPASNLPVFILIGVVVVAVLALLIFTPHGMPTSPNDSAKSAAQKKATDDKKSSADAGDSTPPLEDVSSLPDVGNLPVVELETTLGRIRAKIFTDRAPITANNFLDLVEKKFYDGIIFHRVIPKFMIQTGDPTGTGMGGRVNKGLPPKFLQDEFSPSLRHSKAGILSMANANNEFQKNTGDTQFFITVAPTPHLDNKHPVFGEVVQGLDVAVKISTLQTGENDRPYDPPKIKTARIILNKPKTFGP